LHGFHGFRRDAMVMVMVMVMVGVVASMTVTVIVVTVAVVLMAVVIMAVVIVDVLIVAAAAVGGHMGILHDRHWNLWSYYGVKHPAWLDYSPATHKKSSEEVA